MKTPLEIEIKLAVENARKARSLLGGHGFEVVKPRVFEVNVVLDHAERSLRGLGLLLRVRRAGNYFTCTYKGLEIPGRHKSREEREFAVSDFDSCLAVFAGLGYREVFRYEKYRTEFAPPKASGHAMLDETPVGVYVELEGSAPWIDRTAKSLGFPHEKWITASYASLYLEWCAAQGVKPSNMTFRKLSRPR